MKPMRGTQCTIPAIAVNRFSTVQKEMLAGVSFLDLQYVTHHETEGGWGAFLRSLRLKFTVTGGLIAISSRESLLESL